MGAIEDDELRDVLLRSPRGMHALPLPIGMMARTSKEVSMHALVV